ncbi:MAG: sulfotransferase, partial [Synechococcus sp.]
MSSKRLKLLLIRGLGHSGTTMLDLGLGAHPQIIGLGE